MIYGSPYNSKIKIVEGIWDSEEDQRNAVVKQAREDEMDFLIIQDPDEFYLTEEYLKNLKTIEQYPTYPFYYNPWINFWKRLDQALLERKNILGTRYSTLSISANFALNLRQFPDIHFQDCRRPNFRQGEGYRLPGICYHLSYVHSDEDMNRKVSTWGHSHQVHKEWMRYKWYGWTNKTKFLHPLSGPIWQKVVRFNGDLPKELEDFPLLNQQHIQLTPEQRKLEKQYDWNQLKIYYFHHTKGWIAKQLKLGQYKLRKKTEKADI